LVGGIKNKGLMEVGAFGEIVEGNKEGRKEESLLVTE